MFRQLERPTLGNLDDITTVVFNAVESADCPAFDPIDCLADLECDGLDRPIEHWKVIRAALEKIPDDALVALCALKGW